MKCGPLLRSTVRELANAGTADVVRLNEAQRTRAVELLSAGFAAGEIAGVIGDVSAAQVRAAWASEWPLYPQARHALLPKVRHDVHIARHAAHPHVRSVQAAHGGGRVMPRTIWTPDNLERLRNLYADTSITVPEIAERMGVSYGAVNSAIHYHQIALHNPGSARLSALGKRRWADPSYRARHMARLREAGAATRFST